MRMVVGHTIQESAEGFRVRPICEGQVLLADTAISRAYGGEPSFIEHDGEGGATVVYPRLNKRQELPRPPGAIQSRGTEEPGRTAASPGISVRQALPAAEKGSAFGPAMWWIQLALCLAALSLLALLCIWWLNPKPVQVTLRKD